MKMKDFYGVIPPAVTPLLADSSLDVGGLERLLEHMISGGIHGVFILGSTGEGPALGCHLQEKVMRETQRIVHGRIPILTGISAAAMQDSIDASGLARKYGADALVAAPPCYYMLGEPELIDYYSTLAKAVSFPLFIYNMPSMTKVYIRPETVFKLAEIPGIRGYKDSSGNMQDFHEVILNLQGKNDFSIFIGPEELLGEAVLFGADGGICGGANLNPALYVSMYNAAKEGKVSFMRRLQAEIYEQRRLYSIGHHQSCIIKGIKAALKQKGICSDELIAPFNHFEKEAANAVSRILETMKAGQHAASSVAPQKT